MSQRITNRQSPKSFRALQCSFSAIQVVIHTTIPKSSGPLLWKCRVQFRWDETVTWTFL